MDERIKLIRKHLKLSQEKFGDTLGISRDVVANIENGRVRASKTLTELLILKFNINPEWLYNGIGEMLSNSKTVSDSFFDNLNCDELDRKIIETYAKLTKEDKEVLKTFMKTAVCDGKPLTDKQNEYVNEIKLSQQTTMETAASDGRPATDAEKKKALQIISAEEVDADEF